MTVYVDDVFIPARVGRIRARWCHLLSDAEDKTELHAMARRIGLHRSYFQDTDKTGRPYRWWQCHYDVTEGKRAAAIMAGAVSIGWRDWVERTAEFRAAASDTPATATSTAPPTTATTATWTTARGSTATRTRRGSH